MLKNDIGKNMIECKIDDCFGSNVESIYRSWNTSIYFYMLSDWRFNMSKEDIFARCLALASCHFLNTPYKNIPVIDLYGPDGFENSATEICHYCTADTLNAILNKNCLRFTDIRFLNDSTEFIEIIPLIIAVVNNGNYKPDFKDLILNSIELRELREYRQSYIGHTKESHNLKEMAYHTYTCSFSKNSDSLSLWNYYATTSGGINIVFDFAWNMFKGSNRTQVNTVDKLKNDIMIYRGLVIYQEEDKKKCITELLNLLYQIYCDTKDEIEKYRSYILYAFKESVNHMRCFFKNEHFINEEEYRVVLKIPEEFLQTEDCCDDIVGKGVFKRGNILIPYVDYKFEKESIKRITMNPYVSDKNSIFEMSIENLIWMNKLEDIEIVKSIIPIRKYD